MTRLADNCPPQGESTGYEQALHFSGARHNKDQRLEVKTRPTEVRNKALSFNREGWNKLPREVMVAPHLKGFRSRLAAFLEGML